MVKIKRYTSGVAYNEIIFDVFIDWPILIILLKLMFKWFFLQTLNHHVTVFGIEHLIIWLSDLLLPLLAEKFFQRAILTVILIGIYFIL